MVNGLPADIYDVSIAAVSKAGSSAAVVMEHLLISPVSLGDGGDANSYLTIFMTIFAAVVILVSLFVYLYIRKAKSFGVEIDSKKRSEYESMGKPFSEMIQRDEWEIHPENITFEGILGEGAFGLVKKGILKQTGGQSVEVAIKMLKRKKKLFYETLLLIIY